MATLNFILHPKQEEVYHNKAKNKVVAAGRRWGKTRYAAMMLLIEGLKSKNDDGLSLDLAEVFYVCPTFNQGKDNIWNMLIKLGGMASQGGVISSVRQNEGIIKLVNGRTIKIKGSDRPDTLRGVGLSFVVMDEYASMKPEVWDLIISPALTDYDGAALFIGTPDGKNHFYELWTEAYKLQEAGNDQWAAFQFNSSDNPHLKKDVIERKRQTLSAQAFRQEFEASFTAGGGGSFKEEHLRYADEPDQPGNMYIAIDLAGFGKGDGMIKSAIKKLDEHAISVVEVSPSGWFVHEIIHGRWDVRETALRIIKAAKDYRPVAVGIEKGIAYNAVLPYLEDEMKRMSIFPVISPMTHGGQNKINRIVWALQGRAERGRLTLKKDAPWIRPFIDQWLDFPNPMAHDDLLDSLAYIDQISQTNYNINLEVDDYEPLDSWIGI